MLGTIWHFAKKHLPWILGIGFVASTVTDVFPYLLAIYEAFLISFNIFYPTRLALLLGSSFGVLLGSIWAGIHGFSPFPFLLFVVLVGLSFLFAWKKGIFLRHERRDAPPSASS